jgi:hypothetical protein
MAQKRLTPGLGLKLLWPTSKVLFLMMVQTDIGYAHIY